MLQVEITDNGINIFIDILIYTNGRERSTATHN